MSVSNVGFGGGSGDGGGSSFVVAHMKRIMLTRA